MTNIKDIPYDVRARRFGSRVLNILESNRDWNADTFDLIRMAAEELGLSGTDAEGYFTRLQQ